MKNQYEIDYQQGYDTANDEWLAKIDEIRAEIEQEPYISKMEVLDILDKYIAESEDKE